MCLECDEKPVTRRAFLGAVGLVGAAFAGAVFADQKKTPATEDVRFKNGADSIDAFLARPLKKGKRRAVLILHGNAALPEDVRAAARAIANHGLVGFAVSSTSREPDASQITREFLMSDRYIKRYVADAQAGAEYLATREFFDPDGFGVLGFCGGGYTAARLAAADSRVKALVAFYAAPVSHPPRLSETDPRPHLVDFIERVKIPMQFHYGTADDLIPNEDVAQLGERLEKAKAEFKVYNYQGAAHGFYNFTGETFRPEYAKTAMKRALAFWRKHLS